MDSVPLPVVTSAAQAAVVARLTVDATGLTPAAGGVAMVTPNWFIEVVHDSQVGGRGMSRGPLWENKGSGRCRYEWLRHHDIPLCLIK